MPKSQYEIPEQCPYFGPSPHRAVWLEGWYAACATKPSPTSQGDAALPDAPLSVFSKGPWTFKETGQNFSGAELDEAAFVAYRDRASHGQTSDDLLKVALAYKDYIDALPSDVVAALPAMPGIDGDWAAEVLDRAARAQAADSVTAPVAQETSPWNRALEIRIAQGWKLTGDRIPVLYTDSINGSQVCRDDLWLCTTAALAVPTPPAQPAPTAVAGPSEFPHEQMDVIAMARYKVMPSHESMFHRFAVVAGDGSQQLYIGREVECENMARKFAGAFLDGAFAFHSMLAAAPTTQPAPQQEAQKPMTYEHAHAIRQGNEIAASDRYFEARPQIDSADRRKVFQAGFERGWDAARAAREGKSHDN